MVVVVDIVRGLLPRVCRGAFSLSVDSIGFSRDQLRSGLSFGSVEDDGWNLTDFASWIGLDRRISVGRSGFGRLDLMLRVEPTRIAGASRS